MLPVFDRPSLQYVVDEARAAGIEHFVFVTGRQKYAIEDYFDRAYELEATLQKKSKTAILQKLQTSTPAAGSCSFVRQQAPLGLGHAVLCARDLVGDEPFAVMLPDMLMVSDPPCLQAMTRIHADHGGNLISVEQVPASQVDRYGIADFGEIVAPGVRRLSGMVEKPASDQAPSRHMISGRYILEPGIFDLLETQDLGAGGEIQLTDAMVRLMDQRPFHAYEFTGRTYDTGSKLGYLEAFLALSVSHDELGAQAADMIRRFADNL